MRCAAAHKANWAKPRGSGGGPWGLNGPGGGKGVASAAPEPVATAEPSVSATPPAAAAAAPMVKRGPGRPRKTPLPVVPPTLKARGGKRKAAAATEPGQ